MRKPKLELFSLLAIALCMSPAAYPSPDSPSQSSQDMAIDHSKAPWQAKHLPPDIINSSAKPPSKPIRDLPNTRSSIAVPDNYIPPSWSWYHSYSCPSNGATTSPPKQFQIAPVLPGMVLKQPTSEQNQYIRVGNYGGLRPNRSAYSPPSSGSDAFAAVAESGLRDGMGYLIDTDSAKQALHSKDPLDFVRKYSRQTALVKASSGVGYMFYVDGKWYVLDSHGNKLARDVIKRSIKRNGYYVRINGEPDGHKIIVKELIEILDTPALEKPNIRPDRVLMNEDRVHGKILKSK